MEVDGAVGGFGVLGAAAVVKLGVRVAVLELLVPLFVVAGLDEGVRVDHGVFPTGVRRLAPAAVRADRADSAGELHGALTRDPSPGSPFSPATTPMPPAATIHRATDQDAEAARSHHLPATTTSRSSRAAGPGSRCRLQRRPNHHPSAKRRSPRRHRRQFSRPTTAPPIPSADAGGGEVNQSAEHTRRTPPAAQPLAAARSIPNRSRRVCSIRKPGGKKLGDGKWAAP